jgi:hypothetical protein
MSRSRRQRRHSAWRWWLRTLAVPACLAALAIPASAAAAPEDLRSPDARDAAQAQSRTTDLPSEPATPTVIHTTDDASQTLPIVLSSMALLVALAGIGVALGALYRRPRPRWTAR